MTSVKCICRETSAGRWACPLHSVTVRPEKCGEPVTYCDGEKGHSGQHFCWQATRFR